MLRFARHLLALLAACAVTLGTAVVVVPSAADAAKTGHSTSKKSKKKPKKKAKPPKPVTIAPNTKVKFYDVKISKKHTVRMAHLRLDMRNPRIALDATIPGGTIGAGRQTITAQTAVRRAVGGVNADFFDIRSGTGAPNGGVIVNGTMLKSPRNGWDANFYVRAGRARIGSVAFSGTVTRLQRPADSPATSKAATVRPVYSVNNLRDLAGDRLVVVTPDLAVPNFGRPCNVAVAVPTADRGKYAVTSTYFNVTSVPRVGSYGVAVVACGPGVRAPWVANIIPGDVLGVDTAIAGGTPKLLVSGGQVIVHNGSGFVDEGGKNVRGRNPETFACVSRSGLGVLLGTIDGRREGSSGVTIPELRRYLVGLRCHDAIVFDGGGSSTLVGRPIGRSSVHVLNHPSDRTGARRVTSGLVVYRR